MSSIIRGDFAKNMTTEVFGHNGLRARLAPRLNFNGQPLDNASPTANTPSDYTQDSAEQAGSEQRCRLLSR